MIFQSISQKNIYSFYINIGYALNMYFEHADIQNRLIYVMFKTKR